MKSDALTYRSLSDALLGVRTFDSFDLLEPLPCHPAIAKSHRLHVGLESVLMLCFATSHCRAICEEGTYTIANRYYTLLCWRPFSSIFTLQPHPYLHLPQCSTLFSPPRAGLVMASMFVKTWFFPTLQSCWP